jgi:flagellar hook assembly protein FlgD
MAFDLPTDSDVTVKVFDASGRLVATLVDGTQRGGRHTVAWSGRDAGGRQVGAGVYFCRMVAGEFTQTQKVVVVR